MCSTENSQLRQRPKRAAVAKPAPVVWVPTKPRRRGKPRRKPKYLSLKLDLPAQKMQEIEKSAVDPPSSPPLIAWMPSKKKKNQKRGPLLALPLRPEEEVDREDQQLQVGEDQQHVALLFEMATDGTSSALHGLLDPSSSSEVRDPLSPSLICVYSYGLQDYKNSLSRQGCGTDGLLRTAMRCKEREAREEERWVSYNEVVEAGAPKREQPDQEEEDASSNCMTGTSRSSITDEYHGSNGDNARAKVQQLVGLKLDKYQDILDAWSDKPPFCFSPRDYPRRDRFLSNLAQIVPDLHHPVSMDIAGSVESLWRVPDSKLDDKNREKDQMWQTGQREASVLRYKEKRQSRLFSKRIRYEVRKVNAEMRPRLKGRFVKRNEGTRDIVADDTQQLVLGHEEHGS